MATLLLVRYADGHRGRCDQFCHDGGRPGCPCVCGGAYHGLGEGSAELERALLELQPMLLMSLSFLEQAGALSIVAWREVLTGPLMYRSQLRRLGREEQTVLWPAHTLRRWEVSRAP